jgi:hypothetical protein
MNLDRIYQPIADDLKKVERFLEVSVKESNRLDTKFVDVRVG